MGSTLLITGGTGLVGKVLIPMLEKKGHRVHLLSREPDKHDASHIFRWDVRAGTIDPKAWEGVTEIIHLAGAGVADSRWTEERKKIIIDSRVDSAALLLKKAKEAAVTIKTFISASATGIYGTDTGDRLLTEESPTGNDFLAEVCERWEDAALKFEEIGARVAMVRTGIALSTRGGALEKLMIPVRFGLGAPLGSGQQQMPWLHLEDLCRIYVHILENDGLQGPYNAAAPDHANNREVTRMTAEILNRPFFMPSIPGFLLRLALGDMSSVVLGGNKVSSQKIMETGFEFNFPKLPNALADLIAMDK